MDTEVRRRLIWSFGALLVVSAILFAVFLAFWFVTWPFSHRFVMSHSPWIPPLVRAYAKREDTDADEVAWDQGRARLDEMTRSHPVKVQQELIGCMQDGDPYVRWVALELIELVAEHGPLGADLCAAIVAATKDRDHQVRLQGCAAVRYLPSDMAEPLFLEMFDSGERQFQSLAVKGMVRLGKGTLTPKAIALLQDSDPDKQLHALNLLVCTEDEEVAAMIEPLLQSPHPEVAKEAQRCVRKLKRSAK